MCILNRERNGTEHPIKLTPHVKKCEELLEIELFGSAPIIIFSGTILTLEQRS